MPAAFINFGETCSHTDFNHIVLNSLVTELGEWALVSLMASKFHYVKALLSKNLTRTLFLWFFPRSQPLALKILPKFFKKTGSYISGFQITAENAKFWKPLATQKGLDNYLFDQISSPAFLTINSATSLILVFSSHPVKLRILLLIQKAERLSSSVCLFIITSLKHIQLQLMKRSFSMSFYI